MNITIFAWLTGAGLSIAGTLYLIGLHNDRSFAAWIVISIGIGLAAAAVAKAMGG